MTATRAPAISPTLRNAIAVDAVGCAPDAARLAPADVAAIWKLLAEGEAPGFDIDMKRTLGALSRSDRSPETAALLSRVLQDRKAPLRERTAAAAYLGRMPAALSEAPLVEALDATTPIRTTILKSLAQVGGEMAMKRLAALKLPDDDPGSRPLALARLAIAMRRGEPVSAEALETALDIRWTRTEAARAEPGAVKALLARLDGDRWGLEPDPDSGFTFPCGPLRHTVVLDRALKRGAYLKMALARPHLAGFLLTERRDEPAAGVRWLLLTTPVGEGLRMALVRPGGEPAFEGEALPDPTASGRGALRFVLRDTGLERTPAEISGRITDDDVSWTLKVWRGPLRGKQRPRPLAPRPLPTSR